MSHWYKRDGSPCYEVPNKSKPGEMRKTKLGDARILDLLPSVTGILDMMAKPGLDRWKQEQIILACIKNPIQYGETEEVYAKHVSEAAKEISEKAASLGTEVHNEIEQSLILMENPDVFVVPKPYKHEQTGPIIESFMEWLPSEIQEVVKLEDPFASPLGYGGKIDIIYETNTGRSILADFKTQSTKPGKPVNSYNQHGMQLAAYAKGTNRWEHRLKIIILSTTEPGRIEIVDWTDRKEEMWKLFEACLTIWKITKKYDPSWERE